MGQRPATGNRNAWIIGGAIVLAALLIVIALALLLGGNGTPQAASPSASIQQPTPTKSRAPRHRTPTPSPPPSPSPSPSPSASPTIDPTVAVRAAAQRQASRDRPGELKHVGQVQFYTDKVGCPQTGQAAGVSVRFTTDPKAGTYIFCKARVRWKYADGPIYGE